MPKSKKAVEVKTPKQARLPSMEDPKIEELEALAETYAQVRDDRMALNTDEVDLKDRLLATMKKHKKTTVPPQRKSTSRWWSKKRR
jgi:hypothetical protein